MVDARRTNVKRSDRSLEKPDVDRSFRQSTADSFEVEGKFRKTYACLEKQTDDQLAERDGITSLRMLALKALT